MVLIHQPAGVLDSTLFQLGWLNRNEVSSIIIANHPLSKADHAALSPLCHLIIDRPNIGYDFGGYRDGVLTLSECGMLADALYIINDSIWFPLDANSDVIEKCRASSAGLFGPQMSQYSKRTSAGYIQSYFFRFSSDPLRSLGLINDKYTVVKRQERNLTPKFVAQAWSQVA